MLIKNLAAKVIGIGGIEFVPGSDWVNVDNKRVYAPVFDAQGVKTDKMQVLPSLQLLRKMGQIDYREDQMPLIAQTAEPTDADNGKDDANSTEEVKNTSVEETSKTGGRKTKTTKAG